VSALLVAAGAVLLWPVLAARHGRGIALATLVALVFGTVVYGLARGPSWEGAAAFALVAALVRVLWGRAEADDSRVTRARRISWIVALVVAVGVLVVGGAGPADVLDGLFSSWSGLLFWSPVLWLGVFGCLRERPAGPGAALGPALLVAAAVGAVTLDDGPYRGARLAPFLPLLALGLARAFNGIRNLALHRPLVPVAIGMAALVAWNALLMAQYRDGRIPRDDTVAFARIARNAAATVSAAVGSPTAWPANWIFAARHGVSAARYDLLGGVDLFGPLAPGSAWRGGPPEREGVIDVGHLPTDEALLQEGWSVRHPCGDGVCRAVEGTAALLAPIRAPRDVDVALVAQGAGALTMAVNGVPVLAAPLTADAQTHTVRLPRARLRRGLNVIVFTIPPGGHALVDRIVFRAASAGAGVPPWDAGGYKRAGGQKGQAPNARADAGPSGGPKDPPFK
jgi:hypothetical protein